MNKRLKKKQKRKAEKAINNLNHFFNKHEKEIKKLDREIAEINKKVNDLGYYTFNNKQPKINSTVESVGYIYKGETHIAYLNNK